MTTIIVRSVSTGKYHLRTAGTDSIFCNYTGRTPRVSPARCEEVSKAGEHMFCRKCFPTGKPKA